MAVVSSSPLSLLCSLLVLKTILTSQVDADDVNSQDFHYFCDSNNDRGNYTTNSPYHRDLNTVLKIIPIRIESTNGFANTSSGSNADTVNGMGQCRGDVTSKECRQCLNEAVANLTQLCPNRKEAIGWYENEKCMRWISGLVEYGPAYFVWNDKHNATKAEQFNQVVKDLLDKLRRIALSGDARRKYAT